MVATMKGLQEHLHSLHEAFGRQACQDLRQLGAEPFAAALDSLDRTGSGAHRLAAARALSSRCSELLQQQGWPHPAYRCGVPQEQLTGCCANLQPSPLELHYAGRPTFSRSSGLPPSCARAACQQWSQTSSLAQPATAAARCLRHAAGAATPQAGRRPARGLRSPPPVLHLRSLRRLVVRSSAGAAAAPRAQQLNSRATARHVRTVLSAQPLRWRRSALWTWRSSWALRRRQQLRCTLPALLRMRSRRACPGAQICTLDARTEAEAGILTRAHRARPCRRWQAVTLGCMAYSAKHAI